MPLPILSVATLASLLLFSTMATAAPPETTFDGLQRVPSERVDVLYIKPGASLRPYKNVAILDCPVAFRKDWQRDRNTGAQRVSAKDMERIKTAISTEFRKAFTTELEKGGYGVVTEAGDDVLILRPAIINLDIVAPDIKTAGRSRTFSTSAGAMTLYLEAFDGGTGEILARVVDPVQARDEGFMRWQTSVTNRQEMDRILGKWAALARGALDRAHQSEAGAKAP